MDESLAGKPRQGAAEPFASPRLFFFLPASIEGVAANLAFLKPIAEGSALGTFELGKLRLHTLPARRAHAAIEELADKPAGQFSVRVIKEKPPLRARKDAAMETD